MLSLRDRLLCAEDDFLSALARGGDSLSAFDERWQNLLDDVDSAINTSTIDHETATLAFTIATRCALLADTSASLFATYDTLTSQLVDQLDIMMSELSITERPCCLSPSTPPAMAEKTDRARPSPTKRRRVIDQEVSTKRRRISSPSLESSNEQSSSSARSSVPRDAFATCPPTQSNLSAHRTHKRRTSSSGSSSHPSPAPSRKRRLSEDNTSGLPPGAKRLYAGPRLHAVSDSYSTLLPTHNSIPPLLLALEPSPLPPDTTMPLDIQSFHSLSTATEFCLMDNLSDLGHMGDVDAQVDPVYSLDPMGLDLFLTSVLDTQMSREQTPSPAFIPHPEDAASPSSDSVDSPRSIDSDCSPAVTPSPITPPANGYLDLPLSFADSSLFDSIHHDDAFVLTPSECHSDWLSLLSSPFADMGDTSIPAPSCAISLSSDTRCLELRGRDYELSLLPLMPDQIGSCPLLSNNQCSTVLTIT